MRAALARAQAAALHASDVPEVAQLARRISVRGFGRLVGWGLRAHSRVCARVRVFVRARVCVWGGWCVCLGVFGRWFLVLSLLAGRRDRCES